MVSKVYMIAVRPSLGAALGHQPMKHVYPDLKKVADEELPLLDIKVKMRYTVCATVLASMYADELGENIDLVIMQGTRAVTGEKDKIIAASYAGW